MGKITGIDTASALALQQQFGYNELPVAQSSLIRMYLKSFWGPLPWLLELTIVISIASGNPAEAIIITALLLLNGSISLYHNQSADKALASLRRNLQITARVIRDGEWVMLPAREIVVGDTMRLRMGDVVSADAVLLDGALAVDFSSLTGESLPRDITTGDDIYSGCVISRGEATVTVTGIGVNTKYGHTTQLLEASHPPTHMESVVFSVIKYVSIANVILAISVAVFGFAVHISPIEIMDFVIVLLLMSIPVAFPTMFAVAQSYGALMLSKRANHAVLVGRLAAIQDVAMMDVLCSDKTGTLTQNNLSVHTMICYGAFDEKTLLALAGAACDESDQDYIDIAILSEARKQGTTTFERLQFSPFDSNTKRTEAVILRAGQKTVVRKGMPDLLLTNGIQFSDEARRDLEMLSESGFRTIAVTIDDACVGLIALSDPIRPDAPRLIREIERLGIRVVMITGDGRATAAAVANQLGLVGDVVTASELAADPSLAVTGTIFAETYPENKINIIRALQEAGHIVGMTGDGVNDAPALHQAEVGIAVASATDVAKQSASLILTSPGLDGVRVAVNVGRSVSERIKTWIMNKMIKSIEVTILTSVLFMITRTYILSPLLAVLLMISNDFVTVSIATDKAQSVRKPVHWDVLRLAVASLLLAFIPLALVFVTYAAATSVGYPTDGVRTAVYAALVYYGMASLLAIRSWPNAWSRRPSKTLVTSLAVSLIFTFLVSVSGRLIPAISIQFMACIVAVSLADTLLVDFVKKTRLMKRLIAPELQPLRRNQTKNPK